jgi:hypothetical protein
MYQVVYCVDISEGALGYMPHATSIPDLDLKPAKGH